MALHWKDDGGSAHNPQPDWWDEVRLDEVGGKLIYTESPGGQTRRELIDDPARLVELSAQFGDVGDEELAEALALLD